MTKETKGWTAERRQAQRELMLKLKPWEKSTGPKTTRGKRRCAQNARKTGFYSKEMKLIRSYLKESSAFLNDLRLLDRYIGKNRL